MFRLSGLIILCGQGKRKELEIDALNQAVVENP
jgi:hypothetical protein